MKTVVGTWFCHLDGSSLQGAALETLIPQKMAAAKVLHISGMAVGADARGFWQAAGQSLGRCADTLENSDGEGVENPGGWMDVRFDPDRLDTYRHANVGQPLHNDAAYGDVFQDIGLFYLEKQASAGGESLFIGGEAVVEYARSVDPGLLARLLATEVKFGKGEFARTRPILREVGGRVKVNWNWFRVLPDQGEAVGLLREDFRLFLEAMVADGVVHSFLMQAGDVVFFRDDEVLHGRKDFEAVVSGDRLLWKTYFITPEAQAAAPNATRAA